MSHNAGAALGKQVRAVWIETLQKNQPKPQQFVSPQGPSGGVQEISKIKHNDKGTRRINKAVVKVVFAPNCQNIPL